MRPLAVLIIASVLGGAEWLCLLDRPAQRFSVWDQSMVVTTASPDSGPQIVVSLDGGATWSQPTAATAGVAGQLGIFYLADGAFVQWGSQRKFAHPGFVRSMVADGQGTIWLASDQIKRVNTDTSGNPVLESTGNPGSIISAASHGVYASLSRKGDALLTKDDITIFEARFPDTLSISSSFSDWMATSIGMFGFTTHGWRHVRLDPPDFHIVMDYQSVRSRLVALARDRDGVRHIFTSSPSIDDSWTSLPVGLIPPTSTGIRIIGSKLLVFGPDGVWALAPAQSRDR